MFYLVEFINHLSKRDERPTKFVKFGRDPRIKHSETKPKPVINVWKITAEQFADEPIEDLAKLAIADQLEKG